MGFWKADDMPIRRDDRKGLVCKIKFERGGFVMFKRTLLTKFDGGFYEAIKTLSVTNGQQYKHL